MPTEHENLKEEPPSENNAVKTTKDPYYVDLHLLEPFNPWQITKIMRLRVEVNAGRWSETDVPKDNIRVKFNTREELWRARFGKFLFEELQKQEEDDVIEAYPELHQNIRQFLLSKIK